MGELLAVDGSAIMVALMKSSILHRDAERRMFAVESVGKGRIVRCYYGSLLYGYFKFGGFGLKT